MYNIIFAMKCVDCLSDASAECRKKGYRKKRHRKKGTGKKGTGKNGTGKMGIEKMGTNKKGTSEKLGKKGKLQKKTDII